MKVFNALIIFLIISISIGFGSAFDIKVDLNPRCLCAKGEKVQTRLRLFNKYDPFYIFSKTVYGTCNRTQHLVLKDIYGGVLDTEAEVYHPLCKKIKTRMPVEKQCRYLESNDWYSYHYSCYEKNAKNETQNE
uniref:NTR domain-containing protein n=1 Tax=Strongyloides papillosus TaxID=174720 RepID=A0A0N5CFA8_STREA